MKINQINRMLIDVFLNNNHSSYTSNQLNYSKRVNNPIDTVELSSAAQQRMTRQKSVHSLTHIKRKEIEELKAKSNTLEFREGAYYRFSMNGYSTLLEGSSSGHVGLPILDLRHELGVENVLSEQEYKRSRKIESFFSSLAGSPAGLIGSWDSYSGAETLHILSSVGIDPGWFTIKSGSESNTFYLRENGKVIPKYQMEGARRALNNENLFEIGYSEGETLIVNNVEYVIDDTGHVHIPEGVPVFHSFYDGNIDLTYHERSRQKLLEKNNLI
ncbi:hypothetical protein CEW92_02370 [Bacillaceae bacterium SAS-127]|nr:hypothetical protein CEW92_02370 [Bacillaceae bacterium SAS-127]